MKLFKRIALILCLALLLSVPARAASGSITVHYAAEGTAMTDVQFQLYRVEESYEAPADAYADILRSGRTSDHQGVTDANGMLVFADLAEGTYLLTGTPHRVGNKVYETEMALYTLPCADEEGNLTSNITIEPKHSQREDAEEIEYRVLVIWESPKARQQVQPDVDEVLVHLYRNDALAETVSVKKADDWQYSWTETDAAAQWFVVEDVPKGYTVRYSREGNTFLIINTPTLPEPTEPDISVPTTPQEPTPDEPKLPQTGQLWWPVPLMAMAGMVLFLLGWLRRKESGHEG